MSHFKLRTDLTKNFFGLTLFRLELTIDCKWGKKGELGGWVEKESNVSSDAWVSGNARVSGNAQVYGDASKTPIHIIGTKYHVTIADNQVAWGCRQFTFDEVKALEFKDLKTSWDESEFKLNKKIITESIRYYRK